MSQDLSFIDPQEEQEAKAFIEEHLGFPAPRMAGYHMAVKIYVRPEELKAFKDDATGEIKYIYLPDSVSSQDKWRNCTALVVSQGSECYKTGRFKEDYEKGIDTRWCKVGDWVVIPRNEGTQVNYRGVPMQLIPDDRVLAVIDNPEYVTRD